MKKVSIFSRKNCHLCDLAKESVELVQKEIAFDLKIIFIDGSDDLENQFGDEVPVIFIDGARHDFGRVNIARFKAALI